MRDLTKATADTLPAVDVFGRLLRRLEGRRIEVERKRRVTLVIGEVVEAVPANEVVVGVRGTAVPIWHRVVLDVHSIRVGDLAAERAEVTAADVRFVDRGAQRLTVASLSARVLLTEAQLADLVADLDLPAEVDVAGTRLVVRPRWSGRRLAISVTPTVAHGTLHLRPDSVQVFRWSFPAPFRLPMTLDFPLRDVPENISVGSVRSADAFTVEATVEVTSLELPFDLRQMVTELGTEGARVAVRMLSGEIWRSP